MTSKKAWALIVLFSIPILIFTVLGVISVLAAWEDARQMRAIVLAQTQIIGKNQQVIEAKQRDHDEIMVQFDHQFFNVSKVLGNMDTWNPVIADFVYPKPHTGSGK